jgi:pyruvate dehydrogenase kinase 2/3/4
VSRPDEPSLPESTPNPALSHFVNAHALPQTNNNRNGFNKLKLRVPMERRCVVSILCGPRSAAIVIFFFRYYANTNKIIWPPEVQHYNKQFTNLLEHIKRRHDPTVTTVAQGVLEWKRSQNAKRIGLDIQAWLDRFYLSRIGIRFLIGQRSCPVSILCNGLISSCSDIALNTQQAHEDYVGIICTKAVRASNSYLSVSD